MRALLVDDEPLALRRLEILLRAHADVELAGCCASGEEAIEAIATLRPDLALLDVRMPGLDGLAAARAVVGPAAPAIVFVTAYDSYAVEAFRTHAVDYLLKPVDPARLSDALDRVRKRLSIKEAVGRAAELEAALDALRGAQESESDDIWIKDRGRTIRVRQADISWVEAERDYVRVHVQDASWLMRETMTRMEERLDPERFVRVHRSAIVNRATVAMARHTATGGRLLVLTSGARVKVGRSYEPIVSDLVGA